MPITRESVSRHDVRRSRRQFRAASTSSVRRGWRARWLRTSGVVTVAVALSVLAAGAAAHAEELVLQAGETRVLPARNHRFDVIRLGPGATIELTGTTRLIAEKLVTAGDASVRYQGSDTGHGAKFFDFVILDGRGMQGTLSIDGSGKSRPEARRGDTKKHHGGNGEPGAPGEAGMNMDLSLFQANPDAHVTLVSRGGRGGKGGDGGTGTIYSEHTCKTVWGGSGAGVHRGDYHTHRHCWDENFGGRGGDGANGGKGGDAGRIRIFLVHQESASEDTLDMLLKFGAENVRTEAVAGKGGDGGASGRGEGGAEGGAGVAGGDGATREPMKALLGARDWLKRAATENTD